MTVAATILVVDNESDQLEMMEAVLGRIGCEAWTTDTPQQALKWVAQHRFDMVFIDLIMPEVDGTELCEQIKQIRPAVSVYAFSGHAHLYDLDRLKRVGFDGTIRKPATMEEIKTAVHRAMGVHPRD